MDLSSISEVTLKKIGKFLKSQIKSISISVFFCYTVIALLLKTILVAANVNYDEPNFSQIIRSYNAIPHVYIYLCFILLFTSFSFLFKGRAQLKFLIIINLLFSILFIGDLWYFRGFSTFPTLYLLKETTNLDNLSSSIASMIHKSDILFLLDFFIIIPYSFFNKKLCENSKRSLIVFVVMFIIASTYTIYVPYKVQVLKKYDVEETYFATKWKPSITLSNLSPVGYHVIDTYNFFKDSKQLVLSNSDKTNINKWFKDKKENLPDNQYRSMFKGKNLLVIQVESLENLVVNKSVNGQEITPNINKLLGNSLYFSNYNEEVNEGTTSDAELMTNTSIYPVRTGSTFFRYPNNKYYNSLPEIFQRQGYYTQAIHPDKGSYWNWQPALSSIGFQNCIDASKFNINEVIGLGLSDGSYLKQVAPIIERTKQPFYNFMITLTSHAPFELPDKYRELKLSSGLNESHMGGYLQSIHYTDKQIGIFLNELKSKGLLDNTVVVLYGDHCGIHKYYQDELATTPGIENWMIDNHKKIPLIIYQDKLKGQEIKTVGGEIDLMPTLSYLMGINKNQYVNTTMGRNLLNTNESYAIWSDGEWIGDPQGKSKENQAIKGLNIADEILRSDYFKTDTNK